MQPECTFSISQSTSLVIISLFQYITPPPHMLISRKSTVGRGFLLPSELFKNPGAWLIEKWCRFSVLLPKVLLREVKNLRLLLSFG